MMNILVMIMPETSYLIEFSRQVVCSHMQSKTICLLARKTGISRSYLHHFGQGKIINPGAKQVEKIIINCDDPRVLILKKNILEISKCLTK